MSRSRRLSIAVQKGGRLTERSLSMLERCGLDFEWSKDRLFSSCENFPLDLMLLRDDDIPGAVADGVCSLGIVGLNVLEERGLARGLGGSDAGRPAVLRKLGFGECRLCLAKPGDSAYGGLSSLAGSRIATSYPSTLRRYLEDRGVIAEVVELSGSVELAPKLDVADAVCDIVSSGATLRSNGLIVIETVLESECVLARTPKPLSDEQKLSLERLLQRLDGVLKAADAKYVMMNAPEEAVEKIRRILPGMEEPTVIPLGGGSGKVAVHAVAREPVFWETMERLKAAGASSILVVPIEKIIS